MPTPLGRHHPLLREIRRLRRDRRLRDSRGLLLAEGVHLALEALSRSEAIEAAFVASEPLANQPEGRDVLQRVQQAGIRAYEVAPEVLASLQDARAPQPVLLLIRRRRWSIEEIVSNAGAPPCIVLAWGIQDPGNLGALARTARAAGASGLLAVEPCADLFHPRTVRASAGALLDWPAAHASAQDARARLEAAPLRRLAAEPHRGRSYDALDLRPPLAIAFGSEGRGLPSELDPARWTRVRIPLARGMESLPVVAAAAVLLFEAARQRRERAAGVREGREPTITRGGDE